MSRGAGAQRIDGIAPPRSHGMGTVYIFTIRIGDCCTPELARTGASMLSGLLARLGAPRGIDRVELAGVVSRSPELVVRRSPVDQVVLLNEHGEACGHAGQDGGTSSGQPRWHLGSPAYLFNSQDQFLLTRRADSEEVWPGWTNSMLRSSSCLGEDMVTAVRRGCGRSSEYRRRTYLDSPTVRYRARMDDGMLENEMCPVSGRGPTASLLPIRWKPRRPIGSTGSHSFNRCAR